jgi:hypothetical protein
MITLGIEKAPIDAENKYKWDNKNVESHGLIKMSISSSIWFHLQVIDDPNEAWTKFETVFGKHNVI